MSMQKIADAHIEALRNPSKPPSKADILRSLKKYWLLLSLGTLSATLYGLLYYYSAELTQLAQATATGHKAMFFIPIMLALVFSLIHGAFTSHFWDALGIRAKKK